MMDYVKFIPMKPAFISVAWTLGTTCNYSCSYCSSSLSDGKIPFPDYDPFIRFIDKLKDKYPNKKILVMLLGGEVTLWKQLKDFLIVCRLKDIYVRLVSNGSRSVEWWKTVSYLISDLIVSYHTEFADESHITEVMKLFSKGDRQVNLLIPPDKFDETVELGKRISKNAHVYVIPKYLRKKFKTLYPYTQEQLKFFTNRNLEFGTTYFNKGEVRHTALIVENEDGKKTIYKNSREIFLKKLNYWYGWKCWGGIDNFYIDLIGDIFIGQCREGKFGNINEDNYKLPDEPYICTKEACICTQDIIEMRKEKI
jgi:organic radical activating enzyme